ncbi:MAG: restriction endonuclease [Bacteroidetes bacterium]|nr:restriction endonuclease [Bacteroidota bacterium]
MRNGVKFANYVGVIQIGNLVIEILPKADKATLSKENEIETYDKWRRVLLKMLAISGNLKIDSVSQSFLKKRYNSLLELYFEIYLNEVSLLLRRGLVKKYRKDAANVKALKGRINFARNIQENLIHQERFHTTHQCYDFEHLINQILLKGLKVLKQLSNRESIISRVNKLRFAFPEIKEINVDQASFVKINLNRKTETYSEAIKIAKMLILNYSPDISKGQDDMLALLFDMNMLWEKYIYRMLKRREDAELKIGFQESDKFWNNRAIHPDIVIRKKHLIDNEEYWKPYIIDTKWKIVEPSKPSDDDLKQMFAYNLYWDARKSILLYPKTGEKKDGKFGEYHKGHIESHFCKVGFVDVLNEKGELNMGVADDVIRKI